MKRFQTRNGMTKPNIDVFKSAAPKPIALPENE
jgi:hypothetical protein